jgi:hypothetical protein
MNEQIGKGHNERLHYVSIEGLCIRHPDNTCNLKAKDKIA